MDFSRACPHFYEKLPPLRYDSFSCFSHRCANWQRRLKKYSRPSAPLLDRAANHPFNRQSYRFFLPLGTYFGECHCGYGTYFNRSAFRLNRDPVSGINRLFPLISLRPLPQRYFRLAAFRHHNRLLRLLYRHT